MEGESKIAAKVEQMKSMGWDFLAACVMEAVRVDMFSAEGDAELLKELEELVDRMVLDGITREE